MATVGSKATEGESETGELTQEQRHAGEEDAKNKCQKLEQFGCRWQEKQLGEQHDSQVSDLGSPTIDSTVAGCMVGGVTGDLERVM